MAENLNSPVFADRYRFQTVDAEWDRGRGGFTHLVYDIKEKQLGVIKRVETISKKSTEGLKNEVKALKALKGLGVPEVYDTGHAVYDTKNYEYIVVEYIDGIRVEKNLDSLSIVERAEIITQLFGLLSQAHQKGIVNGDVDLKHLFWRKDKKQLVVIDWGNAKLGVDPKRKTEFSYDLARAAEIIFSLVARQGHPLATGSIALPDDSELIAGIGLLPLEFHDLCKWAPRTPSDSAQAPYTSKELFEVSKKWLDAIVKSKRYIPKSPPSKISWLVGIGIPLLGILCFVLLAVFYFLRTTPALATPTVVVTKTSSPIPLANTPILTETPSPTVLTPTETTISTPTLVATATSISSPIVTFDENLKILNCWVNERISPSILKPIPQDGFYRRSDGNWGFNVAKEHLSEKDIIQVDFTQCLGGRSIQALAMNIDVNRLEPERVAYEPVKEREFGFYLVGQDGRRREYTLWIDKIKNLNLRVREDNNIIYNENIDRIVSSDLLNTIPDFPVSYQFSIQMYFQMDDQGQDILYLRKGQLGNSAQWEDINPTQMTRMDAAMFKTLGAIQKIGLVGHGGKTETLIWPLVFIGKGE